MNIKVNQILKNLKVLIIEDNPINAEVLKTMLETIGIQHITIANSGKEALLCFSAHFDMIFTDFKLPDMNGAEITQHYRTVFPKKDTPIICCSSEIELKYRECINAEINGFLSKPYGKEELLGILECWLPQVNFNLQKAT